MKKKIISMVLAVAMSTLMIIPTYAVSPVESTFSNENIIIDENLASTVAALFVGSNLELEDAWTMKTGISDIELLFDGNDDVTAYCVKFYTGDKNTGYVIISADPSKPLIQEYSTGTAPVFETSQFIENELSSKSTVNNENKIVRAPVEKIYYAGSMQYSTTPDIFDSVAPVNSQNNTESQELLESNLQLLTWISESGTLKDKYPQDTTRPRLPVKHISDPLVYLKEAYPSWAFTNAGYHNIGENAIEPYDIIERNACAIYATAAIVKYHVGSRHSFTSIRDRALAIMREKSYYRGNGDYYITNSQYIDFINTVIRYNVLVPTAHKAIAFAWDRGKQSISNNRPIMVNLWYAPGGNYSDHTVTAYAWTHFTANNGTSVLYRFFKVRDGDELEDARYVYMDTGALYPWYITII